MFGTCALEVAPPAAKYPRLSMDDTILPPSAPIGNNGDGKTESRKRCGPAADARPCLTRGQSLLSRQASFDIGVGGTDATEASPQNSSSVDETEHGSQPSPKRLLEGANAATSIRLQRANSSHGATTSSPNLLSNGSSKKISSQQVRQRLKEHLLNRRVMSVEASWGVGGGGGNVDVSTAAPTTGAPSTPPYTHGLRQFSRSFDSDPTASSPSPPLPPSSSSHTENTAPRPSSPTSLPRKRAAYHRSVAMSWDSPIIPPTTTASAARTFEEAALTTLNNIWRESKPPAHFKQPSLGGNYGPLMGRQSSCNQQMAPVCPEDLSKSVVGGPTTATTMVEMPLDLTTATAAAASSESLRCLNNQCLLRRQASVGGGTGGASIKDISLLMQQFEALRNASVQKHLSAFNSTSLPTPMTTSSTTVSVPGLQETAASFVSSLTSFCRSHSVGSTASQHLGPLTTSMFHLHLNSQTSHNLRETQETLAALTLGGSQEKRVIPTTTAPVSPPVRATHEFLRSALERAYDELLRHWSDLPPTLSWPTTAADRKIGDSPMSNETALLFDPTMLSHVCLCPYGNNPQVHPEHPLRIISILERIASSRLQMPRGLLSSAPTADQDPHLTLLEGLPLIFFCHWMRARMATREELAIFHTAEHIARYCSDVSSSDEVEKGEKKEIVSNADGRVNLPEVILNAYASINQGNRQVTSSVATLHCGGMGVDSDTVWNPETTSKSARLAVGQVLCLAHNLASGRLRNGFALVHPPGHHAEPDQAMGFCYFNSVAIAALSILRSGQASRVLIIDWDIHHGNGTQFAADKHPGLLYISLHRYDQGTFFPGTGSFRRHCQSGCTINIPWGCTDAIPAASAATASLRRESWKQAALTKTASSSNDSGVPEDCGPAMMGARGQSSTSSPTSSSAGSIDAGLPRCPGGGCSEAPPTVGLSDAEYLAAFRSLVLPLATEFEPDVVLVSAGFDAAAGHGNALGGYEISPGAFAWMTRQCMSLAGGRVGLVLEGGYVASVTADCVATCLNALLLPNPPASVPVSSSSNNLQRLASLEDCLATAKAWISPAELARAPRPEAAKILLEVATIHASSGQWKCLSALDLSTSADFALPFNRALEQERARLLSSSGVLSSSL